MSGSLDFAARKPLRELDPGQRGAGRRQQQRSVAQDELHSRKNRARLLRVRQLTNDPVDWLNNKQKWNALLCILALKILLAKDELHSRKQTQTEDQAAK